MVSAELQGLLDVLAAQRDERGDVELSIEEWRSAYDGLGGLLPVAPGVSVEAVDAGGVPAEWVGAAGSDGPVVVHLHGGGYCIGSLDSHRSMLSHLAVAVGGRVLSVDYRLAPEHAHPAALDDAVAAYRWVLGLGIDADRTVLTGDSAGGGLVLATMVALREASIPLPAAGVCLSPWVDLTQSGASISGNAAIDPLVSGADLDRWAASYAGGLDVAAPALSPLFADLAGLPPLHVEVGTAEVLLDDATRLATAARNAGVDASIHVAPDMIHVWHFFAGATPEGAEGVERVAEFIEARTG